MGDIDPPANERQARELVPLKDDEQAMVKVWRDLRERHGGRVTAHLVKVEVERQLRASRGSTVRAVPAKVLVDRIDAPRLHRSGTCERCGNRIPVEKEISTYEADSPRKQQIARRAKLRVETLAGTCSGITRGVPGIGLERAVSVADDEEIAGWIKLIEAGAATLKEAAARLDAMRNGGGA